jgi:hypothetical protein
VVIKVLLETRKDRILPTPPFIEGLFKQNALELLQIRWIGNDERVPITVHAAAIDRGSAAIRP